MQNIKDLNTRYDKEDDVLMIFLSKGKIDDAQQTGNMIAHLSKKGELLLKETSAVFPPEVRRQVLAS